MLNDQLWHQALVMDRILELLHSSEQGPNDAMMWTLLCRSIIDANVIDKPWDGSTQSMRYLAVLVGRLWGLLAGERTRVSLHSSFLLGSAILPPSHVPKQNLRTLYVVRTYLSFISDQFPPCFRPVSTLLPDLSPPCCTSPYFTFFTSIHLLISHLSPIPPIFPSARLCYLDFLRTLMFHPYLLCSTRVVFKISSLYSVSSESTLLLSAYSCLICPSHSISKSPRPCVSVRLSESVPDSDHLASSIFSLLCILLWQYLRLYDSQ